jgi:RecJ-like exonuclease
MMDVLCAKCGEPWDCMGDTPYDMKSFEKEKFKRGEGCPCCGFGEYCPLCDGSGKESEPPYCCDTCRDKGYILAWQPHQDVAQYRAGHFYTGYSPNVRALNEEESTRALTIGKRAFPERIETVATRDGSKTEWWLVCPDCDGDNEGLPCLRCEGIGELKVDEDLEVEAARSAMAASDEDGIDILVKRGLL